ncbi:hypothetical protein T439DRAFT_120001 [Meredithblackwellia eburnea MCA 4105]
MTDPTNPHTYPELKRNVWRATQEGEEGELGIAIPHGCVVKSSTVASVAATPREEQKKEDEYEPIVINVEYEVPKPGPGIVVVHPDQDNPSRFPHVFTSAASDMGARNWVPCSDFRLDRCTWELQFIVPRLLYSGPSSRRNQLVAANGEDDEMNGRAGAAEEDDDAQEEDDEEEEEWPISVVASGDLVEQVVHPNRSDRVIWHYAQATPVSVHHIAWAVGPFVVTEVQAQAKTSAMSEAGAVPGGAGGMVGEGGAAAEEDEDEEEDAPEVTKIRALCLPGREAEMAHSVPVLRQAMDYFAKFGSYPFTTYTVAFVDSLSSGSPTFHSAAMSLMGSDLLHPTSIIDQAYETRHLLAHSLAVQWSGVNLVPKTYADLWLTTGIALHMTSLFLRALWGNNEYRFRLKKDMIRCVAQDVQREPLSVSNKQWQPDGDQMQFIALKAPLVLYILDKFLRRSGTTLGLENVLPKIFLDAYQNALTFGVNVNVMTTKDFMKICRKTCGGSLDAIRNFFDQWVYRSGCPTFIVSAMFNRKKMAVELNVTQQCASAIWAKTAPLEESGHIRPADIFEGQMTIRIHEADGTPYEHVLDIRQDFKRHEVPFNTKYKRVRRNTKRYQARQAAATAAAQGDLEAQEDMSIMDVGFQLTQWEDESERERWRVADWSEEDDTKMSQATYEWIRIDADLEWICGVQFDQEAFMWISQLQRDRDIVAQLEAVHALSRLPSQIVASNLAKTVLVTNYSFRIRMEAALALITCATKTQDYLGLFYLFKLFQTRYCFDPETEVKDPFNFRCIPKTNDFTDLTEYFLRKTLVTAISMVRDEKGRTPPVVLQFLVDLLAYNDNLGNKYSDAFYISTVMSGLGHAFVAVATRDTGQFSDTDLSERRENTYLEPALEEVDRYMSSDRLVPSYHNVITTAGIEFKTKLTMANLIDEDRLYFFHYTRDGNYPPVRIAAFDALVLFNPLHDAWTLVQYIFHVLGEDSSTLVQRCLAHSLLTSLPVLAAMHDLAAPEVVFEEESASKKERDPLTSVLKALKKRPGRSINFRRNLIATVDLPDIDPEVRLCLLKLCESTIRPEGEPLPKVRLPARPPSVAATPVAMDIPTPGPTLPKLKLTSSQTASTLPRITIPSRGTGVSPLPLAVDGFETEVIPPTPVPVKKVKVKVPAKVEPSQASGMESADVTVCTNTLKKLFKDKNSLYFRAPVDPVKSGAPGYFDIISDPMDMTTMSHKLAMGQYNNRHQFRDDFKLIIANAYKYNGRGNGNLVSDNADKLDKAFDKTWDRAEETLRRMAEQGPPAGKPPKPPKVARPQPVPVQEPTLETSEEHSNDVQFAVPAVPAPSTSGRTLSFKLSTSASQVSTPQPQPPPPPPAPTPDPIKPSGFKITLGGSSMTANPPPPAVEPPPKPKKVKIPKSTTFSDNLSYAEPPSQVEAPWDAAAFGYNDSVPLAEALPSASHAKHKEKKEKKDKKEKKEKKEKRGRDESIVYTEPDIPSELPPPAPLTQHLHRPSQPHPLTFLDGSASVDVQKALGIIAKMSKMNEALWFLDPVDPTGPLADYFTIIKHPMDLHTMSSKLHSGRYHNNDELFSDFDLIVSNCETFNGTESQATGFVYQLDGAWRAEWEKASRLSYQAKRSLLSLMKKGFEHPSSYAFHESVDTIIDQIPTYYDYINFGDQRDMGTIRKNLEADKYSSIEAFEADIELMLENCFIFNGTTTPIYQCGLDMQQFFREGIQKIRADPAKKRTGGDKAGGGSSKRQKV